MMAMHPLSFVMQSHWLNCGGIESSKLVTISHLGHGKSLANGIGKKNVVTSTLGVEVAQNAIKFSSQTRRLKVLATSNIPVVQTAKKVSPYIFTTEFGGLLKVCVQKENNKYGVYVEVASTKDDLVMDWGIFISDSSSFMPLDFKNSGLDGKSRTIETPLVRKSVGVLAVELNFEESLAPFYFSFLLRSFLESSEIKSHRKTKFTVPVGFSSGYPAPLGFSFLDDGCMNFALLSRRGEGVVLCLYDDVKRNEPALEIDLDPYVNRSGDIWHVSIDGAMPFVTYGYRCKGDTQERERDKFEGDNVLLDPYAKIIGDFIPVQHGSNVFLKCLGKLQKEPAFDWGGDVCPCLPLEKLVVYRLNVMNFTKDRSSKLPENISGTFSGIAEKLHHFKKLGVNAVLLEPIFPSDEQKGPYFPRHFFSPSYSYAPSNGAVSVINSLKEMVKRLHAEGIEVLLEVIFTHTADGVSLEEIDKCSYYHDKVSEDLGTKNALKCNYPIVQQMILDSLRHWVVDFHIDGFCFVNASSLLRGFHGEYLSRPPLVEAIALDPLLSKSKIIADSWDPVEMAAKEVRFPHWKRWAEINTKFCIDVRKFLRGEGLLSNLATQLCGSGDIFLDGRGPAFSFNFISRNFGLTLVDLVSFSGSSLASQLSWNCGEEGPTNNIAVLERRLKQIRNFLFILFISLGVPVLSMGDECGLSSGGNTTYGDRKPFNWNTLRTGFGIQTSEFISFLSSLRVRRSDLLQKRKFLKEENIEWRGSDWSQPSWGNPSSKFLAMFFKADTEYSHPSTESSPVCCDLFVAFNASDHSECVGLPPPPAEMDWVGLVDTALPYPGFFSEDGLVTQQMSGSFMYEMKSHSCVLFEARRPKPQKEGK